MTTARRLHHTYEEYLGALEMSDVKLEYCDGEIYAMAGGTPSHADLAAAVIRLLGNALEGGDCRVSSSGLKVRIEATGLSAFPDVSVACGERRFAAIDKNALITPTLLVEVTSNSTEAQSLQAVPESQRSADRLAPPAPSDRRGARGHRLASSRVPIRRARRIGDSATVVRR